MKTVVIAAPHSGSGKTTLTLGIMAALGRRGLRVAPFKVGPDFIDPGYHRLVTGVPSVNLDGWMCSPDFVRASFARQTLDADIAVIEGVMGLFDGIDGASEAGSSAQIAKLLDAQVVLVVDARSQARSAAALVHGFASFDADLRLTGVIFNNVASANHERILREAMAATLPGIAVVGCLPKDPRLAIPSRHLGLMTAEENPLSGDFLGYLAEVIERHLDLEALLDEGDAATNSRPTPLPPEGEGTPATNDVLPPSTGSGEGEGEAASSVRCGTFPHPLAPSRKGRGDSSASAVTGLAASGGADPVRIAVASDAAFCFVYHDNLRLLEESGAELCYFSPLADSALPDGVSGLYLPGGYPELFASTLAANHALKGAIRRAVEAGLPVYAECGGFIYLTRAVEAEGACHELVGIFPVRTRMLPRRKALGYREVELLGESVIGGKGMRARGHEFHYSEMEEMPGDVERLYAVSRKGTVLGTEGYRYKNCLASYIHLHFGSAPGIAESFVGHCRAYRTRSLT